MALKSSYAVHQISCSAVRNWSAEPGLISGCRPGLSISLDWMRAERYVAVACHALTCSGWLTSRYSRGHDFAPLPTNRRATSRSAWSAYSAEEVGTLTSCSCVVGAGLHTSRSTASWFLISFRAICKRSASARSNVRKCEGSSAQDSHVFNAYGLTAYLQEDMRPGMPANTPRLVWIVREFPPRLPP